ncbi:MAG: cardiolipin synthase, partial [Clostridia bacterium]
LGVNLNYRNHRKIVVVDGDIAYIGGSNIAKDYIGENKRLNPWRDTHIRITGNAVSMLNVRFLQDYNFASGENALQEVKYFDEEIGRELIQIVSDGPDSQSVGIETAYIKAIYSARKSVILQTPYLILDEPFKLALISAVKSGVNVKIMIPGIPDKRFVYSSTMSNAIELSQNGVEIYIHNGFLHSKTLCIDNEISSIGTFNLDIRSFKLHFEVTAFIYGEDMANQLTEDYANELKNCKIIDEEFIKNRTLYEKFKERIAILFSPLL